MSPILLLFVVVLITVVIYNNWPKVPKNFPPGPPRLPIIGSYLHLLWIDYYRPFIALEKLGQHYQSPIISFGMGGSYNVVVANDIEGCREIFTKPEFQGRVPAFPAQVRTFMKNHGFFGDDGDGWLHFRRKTLRALRDLGFGRRSESFESVMEDEMKILVEKLDDTKGKPTLFTDVFNTTMLSLIIYLLHGLRIPADKKEDIQGLAKSAMQVVTGTNATGRLLAIWPWIRFLMPEASGSQPIYEGSLVLQNYIRESIARHREDFDKDSLRDLVDFYLKKKDKYLHWTEENIIIACEDLMFPNAAATSVIISTLLFLTEHPEKLQKCQEQIDDVVGRGRLPTLNDRDKLTMVEASIKEAMRLEPLTPLGVAHRATEDATLCGYDVPKESIVLTNFYCMNRDPKYFNDPETFRPERFIGPGAKDHTLPFGVGKRVCAGETYARQSLFLIIATVLQNFNLEIATPRDRSRYTYGVGFAHNPDLSVCFLPR